MKVNVENRTWGTEIELIPETLKDVTDLFKMVRNSKKQKPEMHLSFNQQSPICYLSLPSLKGNSTKPNSISL